MGDRGETPFEHSSAVLESFDVKYFLLTVTLEVPALVHITDGGGNVQSFPSV